MDIHIHSWDDVNSDKIAEFSNQARQRDSLIIEPPTIDSFCNAIEWWKNRTRSVPIIAYSNDQIVGWLVFFSITPTTATIGRWHPVADPGQRQTEISEQLLQTAIAYAKEQNFERFEAEITGITPQNEAVYEVYKKWYEAQGMHLATEELRLELDLTQQASTELNFPPQFQLRPLADYSNEDLEGPFCEMFDDSKDRFWLDQTMKQRREIFQYWFDRERPFIEESTAVLVKDKEIVGFTIVRLIQDAGMLGPIAVSSRYRRQGLGRALMAFSLRGALQCGLTKMQLEFDIINEPAYQLYTKLGFSPVHRLVLFALRL
ncbi:MAG: GNAT family N-acetyltransferase [Promethearchaeota archaeon]